MKIKIKSLKIEAIQGTLIKPVLKTSSITNYEDIGSLILAIYYYETTGKLEGSEIYGIKYNAFIPFSATVREIEKNDRLLFDNQIFIVLDLKKQIRSYFEDHYELILDKKNKK